MRSVLPGLAPNASIHAIVGLAGALLTLPGGTAAPSPVSPKAVAAPRAEGALPAASAAESCRRHLEAGREFLRRGRYEDALESLELAAETCPADSAARRELGRACLAAGDARRAVTEFRRACAARPSDLEAQEGLAAAFAARCGAERALADSALARCARVVAADPARAEAYRQAARVHEVLGELPESIMMELQWRTVAGADGAARTEDLGRRMLSARLYSEAYREVRAALALDPGDAERLRLAAHLDFRLGRYAAAAGAYAEILRLEPASTSALRERKTLAECWERLGRPEDAARIREEVAAEEPEVARNHSALAEAWIQAGDPGRALAAVDRALPAHGRAGCLWFQRGAALEALARDAERGGREGLARDRRREAEESYGRAIGDGACGEEARRRREALTSRVDSSGAPGAPGARP